MDLRHLSISDIIVDPTFNCRSDFTLSSVEELSKSLLEYGLLMPILVSESMELIAGFRRVRAARYLKWDQIHAIVTSLDSHTARVVNLMENVERKQLSLLEEARALKIMFGDDPIPVICHEMKKGHNWVKRRLRLLTMVEPIQKAADSGRIDEGQLMRLQELTTQASQKTLLAKFLSEAELPQRNKAVQTSIAIRSMLVKFCEAGVEGLPLSTLYWMEKGITDEELLAQVTND